MLKRLIITKLFGKSEPRIINFKSQLTLIVGKNGAGKTTTLSILNALINKDFTRLFNFDFKEASLEFTDKLIRVVKTEETSLEVNCTYYNAFISNDDKTESMTVSLSKDDEYIYEGDALSYRSASKYFPTYRRLETDLTDLLSDNVSQNFYSRRRVINDFAKLLNQSNDHNMVLGLSNKDIHRIIQNKWNEVTKYEKTALNEFLKKFIFSLISSDTNDLPHNINENFLPNVVKADLKQLFNQVEIITESNKESFEKKIDDFIEEVSWAFDTIKKGVYGEVASDEVLSNLNEAFNISTSYSKIEQLLEMYRETYTNVYAKKLPFDELERTLTAFIGMDVFISEGELIFIKEDYPITFEQLSAGEKQLVSMFVYTKLSLPDNGIVIIDEPELSLHINWQRQFLEQLTDGSQQLQYVISTHSPFIVSGYKDNVVQLADMGDKVYE